MYETISRSITDIYYCVLFQIPGHLVAIVSSLSRSRLEGSGLGVIQLNVSRQFVKAPLSSPSDCGEKTVVGDQK